MLSCEKVIVDILLHVGVIALCERATIILKPVMSPTTMGGQTDPQLSISPIC